MILDVNNGWLHLLPSPSSSWVFLMQWHSILDLAPHGPRAALLFLIVNLDIFLQCGYLSPVWIFFSSVNIFSQVWISFLKFGYFSPMRISFLQCEYSYPVVRISWIRRASAECPQSSCLIIFTFLRLEIDLTGSNEGTIILLQAVKVYVISWSDNVLWQCDLTQCNAGRCQKAGSTRVTAQECSQHNCSTKAQALNTSTIAQRHWATGG